MKNPYRPILTKIQYECGQFGELTVFGIGECPIGIASSPMDKGYLEFTVKRYPDGLVTNALHNCSVGTTIGVRGPLGNYFPLDRMEGKNLIIIGGGFAFTTLRSTIRYVLHEKNRARFKKITLVYGARSPGELLYKEELEQWQKGGRTEPGQCSCPGMRSAHHA
jgi:NAD(P)H-flavin reductase